MIARFMTEIGRKSKRKEGRVKREWKNQCEGGKGNKKEKEGREVKE